MLVSKLLAAEYRPRGRENGEPSMAGSDLWRATNTLDQAREEWPLHALILKSFLSTCYPHNSTMREKQPQINQRLTISSWRKPQTIVTLRPLTTVVWLLQA